MNPPPHLIGEITTTPTFSHLTRSLECRMLNFGWLKWDISRFESLYPVVERKWVHVIQLHLFRIPREGKSMQEESKDVTDWGGETCLPIGMKFLEPHSRDEDTALQFLQKVMGLCTSRSWI